MTYSSDNKPSKFLAHLTGRTEYFIKVLPIYFEPYHSSIHISPLDREYHEAHVQIQYFQWFISDSMEH